jgi:hypothetical protein
MPLCPNSFYFIHRYSKEECWGKNFTPDALPDTTRRLGIGIWRLGIGVCDKLWEKYIIIIIEDFKHGMYCDETTNATTSPLAQIYLLTIKIDLPSDVEKIRHFGRRRPS